MIPKVNLLDSQSTPRIGGAHLPKRNSLLTSKALFSPVTPDVHSGLGEARNLIDSPDLNEKCGVLLSHGAKNSFAVTWGKNSKLERTWIELEILEETNQVIQDGVTTQY